MRSDWLNRLRTACLHPVGLGWPRQAKQKTVVIDRHVNDKTGLFGGSLMWIVEALAAAPPGSRYYFRSYNDCYSVPAGVQSTKSLRSGRTISVPHCADDIVDFLLEQRTEFSPTDDVKMLHHNPRQSALPLDKNLTFERAHDAFVGHFTWRPFVTEMVDDFCGREKVNNRETLGVHFRGTDKPGAEATKVDPKLAVDAILDCLARRDHALRFRSLFLATDEQPFVEMLQERLCKKLGSSELSAIRFCTLEDPTRADDGARLAIHHRKSTISSRDCLLYAAVNMLVLSRCAFVLKTPSTLSCFAKIMRPQLPLRQINVFKLNWFPDAAVPLYRPANAELDHRLAMVQEREAYGE